jgi:hypothetical protein
VGLEYKELHLDHFKKRTVGMNFLHELGLLQIAMGIDGAYGMLPAQERSDHTMVLDD